MTPHAGAEKEYGFWFKQKILSLLGKNEDQQQWQAEKLGAEARYKRKKGNKPK